MRTDSFTNFLFVQWKINRKEFKYLVFTQNSIKISTDESISTGTSLHPVKWKPAAIPTLTDGQRHLAAEGSTTFKASYSNFRVIWRFTLNYESFKWTEHHIFKKMFQVWNLFECSKWNSTSVKDGPLIFGKKINQTRASALKPLIWIADPVIGRSLWAAESPPADYVGRRRCGT